MNYGCPRCRSGSRLYTVEQLTGTCDLDYVVDRDPSFDGWTEVDWDSSTTVELRCWECGWSRKLGKRETPEDLYDALVEL